MKSNIDVPVGERHIEGGTRRELVKAHRRVMMNETKIQLIKKLLRMGLCTNDVYFFICNQAEAFIVFPIIRPLF